MPRAKLTKIEGGQGFEYAKSLGDITPEYKTNWLASPRPSDGQPRQLPQRLVVAFLKEHEGVPGLTRDWLAEKGLFRRERSDKGGGATVRSKGPKDKGFTIGLRMLSEFEQKVIENFRKISDHDIRDHIVQLINDRAEDAERARKAAQIVESADERLLLEALEKLNPVVAAAARKAAEKAARAKEEEAEGDETEELRSQVQPARRARR